MINVRIRGIYSTALTRLLLENGFRIIQPSMPIKERFNLQDELDEIVQPDLDIYDRLDRQGVNVVGDESSAETLASLLQDKLDDVIIRRRFSTIAKIDYMESQTELGINLQETLRAKRTSNSQRKIRLDIEFPGSSKKKLDSIRSLVTPTLEGHHCYKACNSRVFSLVEMAEKMLEKGCSYKEVESLFKETVAREFPSEGSQIGIEHVKIDGKIFSLGEAKITKLDSEKGHIRVFRVFLKPGVYDGLGTLKEPGDYAVTDMTIGGWSFRTRYYSKDGIYKGTYINLNTPIELYPTKIRYVDLETDICLRPDGKIQQIDQDKLDKMIDENYVSKRLGKIVKEKAAEILDSLSLNAERDNLYTD
ncbi:MAG: DUF402 domain-containing protein [Candidatus Bathyarchaeia archaeon]